MDPIILARCTGARLDRAQRYAEPIEAAMLEFNISTPARAAAFLAQIGHESGGLRWVVELWGPTEQQRRYEPPSMKAADLGNTEPGDGFKFRGRGLLQVTGRDNYRAAGAALGADLETYPELLGEPVLASRSAANYWAMNGLNRFADSGDFTTLTRRINGGLNGIADRKRLYLAAKEALGVA